MPRRILPAILLIIIVSLAGGLIYYLSMPRLLEVSPSPGSSSVPAGSSLRLEFSRAMQKDSITSRLSFQPQTSGLFTWEGNTLVFTPDRPWPNSATVTIHLDEGGRAASWLATPLQADYSWSFIVEDPLLVYLYPADASANLFSINPQSGEVNQLTQADGEVLDFDISPSGRQIYFSLRQGDGGSAIYILERSSGESGLFINCPEALCRFPAISPTGEWLAYERTPLAQSLGGIPQVWLASLTGNASPLPSPVLVGDATQQPDWSPTGLLTCYDVNQQAFLLYDPVSGISRQVPSQTGLPGDWHPTGKYFVFPEILTNIRDARLSDDLNPIPFSHLLRYQFSDGSLQDLTQMDDLEDSDPVFSPDGSRLAFARKYLNNLQWTPGRQMWVMNPDGSHARAITDAPSYNHYDFAWSPPGDLLAYVRFNQTTLTEPPEIWLVKPDGSQARLLVRAGFSPQWMP